MNKKIPALALIVSATLPGAAAQAQIGVNAQSKAIPQATSPGANAANALAPQASASAIEACTIKMQALLAALDKGDYAGAEMDFDDTMKAGLTPDQLKQAWESLPAKFGAPGQRGAPRNSLSDNYIVITVPMQYQNGNLAAQIACGANGRIAGFHVMTMPFAPAASSAPAPAGS